MQRRSITLRYKLHSGEIVDNHRMFGWCASCNGIRDVEARLDPNAIRVEISELSPKRQTLGGLFKKAIDRALGGNPNDDQGELQRLGALLRLAEKRRTPPHCLTCGGTSIAHLKFDDAGTSSTYVHTCGSRLYQVPADPDAPRFSYRPEIVLLDAEGRRIQQ